MKYFSLILIFILTFGFILSVSADESSQSLTRQAAESLARGEAAKAMAVADKCIKLFSEEAQKIQKDFKNETKEIITKEPITIFKKYRILNDVGMCQFIMGESFRIRGSYKEANKAYKKVITEYPESRNLLEIREGVFILNKLADDAKDRMGLDPQNKFYTLVAVIKVY